MLLRMLSGSGFADGSVGVGKSEGVSQPTVLGPRSSVTRTDMDNSCPFNDRRDRLVSSDKDRVNIRAVNKMSVRDDFSSGSPTPSSKINASICGPRSGSEVAPKLSPIAPRATVSNDWELSQCTNKPPTAGGANNRKRTTSARSSSPPVTHWASQRPLKSSCTAKRINLVPIDSTIDETPSLDTVSDMAGDEIGSGFARRLASSSPQVKLKGDAFSPAALSESEESGAAETKSKEKVKISDEIDEKAGQNVQKVSTLVLPSIKIKLMTREDNGNGVRRQGRTRQGSISSRSSMPMTVQKFGNMGTGKQLRIAKLSLDKAESKTGCPPTRKLTGRKAYARQKHATIKAAADFLVGSEKGHEELVTAVNTLIGAAHAFPNSFWRQMEPFLGFLSDADIAYLKQQGNYELTKLRSTPVPSITNGCSAIRNGCGMLEQERDGRVAAVISTEEVLSPQLILDSGDKNVIPLYQRFIAALIPEEVSGMGTEDFPFDLDGTGFEMDGELGSNDLSHIVNFQSTEHIALNDFRITGKQDNDSEIDMLSLNDTFGDKTMPDMVCSGFQYENMNINEKLLLEAQSIGIFLEPLPDVVQMEDDEICADISKLEEKHNEQVSKKKGLLDKLLEAATETRTTQEKEFEQLALDKLIMMAYEKYMTCLGRKATGGKRSSNKMKQAALAFVNRTLDRCHKFEDTGKSCFDEPVLRDMFLSGFFQNVSESGKPCSNSSIHSLEARNSGRNGGRYAVNLPDLLPPTNQLSDQTAAKDDSRSNRVKRRELLREGVVGGTIGTSSARSGIGSSLSSSTKRTSERGERKVQGREGLSRNGTNKIDRPLSNIKRERKLKAKPKRKATQLSGSVNGLVDKISEQPRTSTSESKLSEVTANYNARENDEFNLDLSDDLLQLPGDLGSWLNIDDEGLDHDFMGLEIPMDDLSDLNMMI